MKELIEGKFPGVEFKEDCAQSYKSDPIWHMRTMIFSDWQCESNVIGCIKDATSDLKNWNLTCVVLKSGEHWWDCQSCFNIDKVASELFDYSLSKHVTKVSIQRAFVLESDKPGYELWLKVMELDKGMDTNIGADLISYISNVFGK